MYLIKQLYATICSYLIQRNKPLWEPEEFGNSQDKLLSGYTGGFTKIYRNIFPVQRNIPVQRNKSCTNLIINGCISIRHN